MTNYYEQLYPPEERPDGMRAPRRRRRDGFIVLALLLLVALAVGLGYALKDFVSDSIDVVTVQGTISANAPGPFDTSSYDHAFLINAIDDLIYDGSNRAILLVIDSPGGGVYETDELYLKLMEYKLATGRPVYASFATMAASGGYYAAMSADKIYCNRNCMTGSIGVRLSTIMDMTGLLDKLGIKAENITAGANKAMGDPYTALTDEQRGIYQAYVDEAYEQFVGIVAQGRTNLTMEQVRTLSDGRIYTAQQAYTSGLVDEIGSFDDALEALRLEQGLENCAVRYVRKDAAQGLWQSVFSQASKLTPKNEVESYVEVFRMLEQQSGYYCAIGG